MACQVILEFHVKDDCIEKARTWLKRILPDTRAFDGCISIAVVQNQDDQTGLVVLEQWVTRQHYERYLQWRTETGVLDELIAMLSGEPKFRFLDYFGV
jgi:quinol monooxygenase YgiN